VNLIIPVGLGGAVGSIARYLVGLGVTRTTTLAFPLATLIVNVLGSLAIGLLYAWLVERSGRPELRAFLMVGVLGGFTTFSSFSLETVGLMMQAQYTKAVINVVASLVLCLFGTMIGMAIGRNT